MSNVIELREWVDRERPEQDRVLAFWRRQESVAEMMAEYQAVARALELGVAFQELDELDDLGRALDLGALKALK